MNNLNVLHKMGVYKILNIENNRVYVGSTIDLSRRKRAHFECLKGVRHANRLLQEDFNLYGVDSFLFEVLEYVYNRDVLLECEQYWIDELNVADRNVGYNIYLFAGSSKGNKHTEESRRKISLSKQNLSDEARKNMSLAHLGKKNKPHSEDTRRKMSLSSMGNQISQEARDKISAKISIPIVNLTTLETFKSATEAGIKYGIDRGSIGKVCKGKALTAGDFKWAYLSDAEYE